VVIADIRMPQIDGLELLAFVRSRSLECKVIMMTGHFTREYLAKALLLGAYDFVEKPFKEGELVGAVQKAVADTGDVPPLADKAAAAMQSEGQTRQTLLDSVKALVQAVEAKDPYTRRHSEQVAHYAVCLATAIGLPASEVESIRVASLLHDIGKIAVPDSILQKPGPLTEEELRIVRRHPAMSADILIKIAQFEYEATLVRYHHERWDGRGYPSGLQGEEIPLGSSIIQVADCIDAMLMERTYKKGYSVQKMLDELVRCAGMQFNPKIASAAFQWCRANPDKLILPNEHLAARAMTV
jgi:response regulator RpfG family c-di-GMP phosphodiesterase